MNDVTRQIMKRFGLDAETALKVQARMEEEGLDFSECTKREFNRAMIEAFQWIKEGRVA